MIPLLLSQDFDHQVMVRHIGYLKSLLQNHIDGQTARGDRPDPGLGSALDRLARAFDLSAFEVDIVALCAAVEFDGDVHHLVTTIQGSGASGAVSFALALAILDNPHWSALAPDRPLRDLSLIEKVGTGHLTQASLKIDEFILHFVTGLGIVDPRLVGFAPTALVDETIVDSHKPAAARLASAWSLGTKPVSAIGGSSGDARLIALEAAKDRGVDLWVGSLSDSPEQLSDLRAWSRVLHRTLKLRNGALFIQVGPDVEDTARRVRVILENVLTPVCVWSAEPIQVGFLAAPIEFPRPTTGEQQELWTSGGLASASEMASRFDFGTAEIRSILRTMESSENAWDSCLLQTRIAFSGMAERIAPKASEADLVLPPQSRRALDLLLAHVRQQVQVYEEWGFKERESRGFGATALFAGQSGTGKTMAAEVLANQLRLDLYRIDLSSVVSKYIGETEKNLRRVFDAADNGGGVLLFDEADALFGKRSEVKDSHDRYANIEVSYLLQRMEAYRGIAVLTTNLKGALDPAFLRRIRFVVNFPFPDASSRRRIWERAFPSATPTEGLDFSKLAQLNVPGGAIRNIALGAAFLAAEDSTPVTMALIQEAARTEVAKMERPMSELEVAGWV